MNLLSEQEIDFIECDLIRRGIQTKSIRDNILDHICILLEERLDKQDNFSVAYEEILKTFYTYELREIEVDARIAVLSSRHLVLNKLQFFLVLFVVLTAPFILYLISLASHISWQAIILSTKETWKSTLAYATWPLSSLIVLFLIPDRLDSPIPRRSRIFIGLDPFISVTSSSGSTR